MMNSDSAGDSKSNPLYCGVKTIQQVTSLVWITIVPPADPLVDPFTIQIAS